MSQIEQMDKVLYTAKTHTTGGRDGASKSSDGRLEVKFTSPGKPGEGTNPEQMFAAGWSACFLGALAAVASKKKITLPDDRAIDAEVDLGTKDSGYLIRARLSVSLPGMDQAQAKELVDTAHQVCPYSKATRGNIEVEVKLV